MTSVHFNTPHINVATLWVILSHFLYNKCELQIMNNDVINACASENKERVSLYQLILGCPRPDEELLDYCCNAGYHCDSDFRITKPDSLNKVTPVHSLSLLSQIQFTLLMISD